MGWDSRCGLSGSCLRVSLNDCSHLKSSLGSILFTWLLAGFISSGADRWRLPLVLCHIGFCTERLTTWQFSSPEWANKRARECVLARWKSRCSVSESWKWHPITVAVSCSLEVICAAHTRGVITKGVFTRGGDIGNRVRGCLLQTLRGFYMIFGSCYCSIYLVET